MKRKWRIFRIVLLLVISIPYVLNMSSQKTGSALYVLRIVRVVLFDVILHIGDTTTDLLQIYYLYQGRYNRNILEYHTTKIYIYMYIYISNFIDFQMIQLETGNTVYFRCGYFGVQLLLQWYITSHLIAVAAIRSCLWFSGLW